MFNPYGDNLLIEGLGPIRSREDALRILTHEPHRPKNLADIPFQVRLHCLMFLRDMHIPALQGIRLVETIDLMIRQSYRYRNPVEVATWSMITGSPVIRLPPRAPAMAAVVVGHSGTGKTEAIQRALSCYPPIIQHDQFPRVVGPHYQVPWLSVDVPPSGKSEHLAVNLMNAWDTALKTAIPNQPKRFTATLEKRSYDGTRMLEEWKQVASAHFLGILHLDEVQNFFHLPTLEARRKRKPGSSDLELSIIEDKCLKWILTLTNSSQFGLLLSGTPDGIAALSKRLSNIQRFVASGYHYMNRFESAEDVEFQSVFFPALLKYQLVQNPIQKTNELATLIISLTGGIRRIIIALWIAAHRVAFERKDDRLLLDDFKLAAATFLAPIAPAVQALNSGDPELMSRYDDLVGDLGLWEALWTSILSVDASHTHMEAS